MNRSVRYLTLAVSNPAQLLLGCLATHRFDHNGGTLGSQGATWCLNDRQHRVRSVHCEIQWIEGAFCVKDRSAHTHMNGNDRPLGLGVTARLNEGDSLQVGAYRLTVHLHGEDTVTSGDRRHLSQRSLAELLDASTSLMGDLDGPAVPIHGVDDNLVIDRSGFHELCRPLGQPTERDPLAALEAASRPVADQADSLAAFDSTHYGLSPREHSQPNLAATRHEAVSGSPRAAQPPLSFANLDTP
jgi:predicted component of type VI protein secretion system